MRSTNSDWNVNSKASSGHFIDTGITCVMLVCPTLSEYFGHPDAGVTFPIWLRELWSHNELHLNYLPRCVTVIFRVTTWTKAFDFIRIFNHNLHLHHRINTMRTCCHLHIHHDQPKSVQPLVLKWISCPFLRPFIYCCWNKGCQRNPTIYLQKKLLYTNSYCGSNKMKHN